MNDFLQELATIVEVDQVHETDALADLPQWDSLTVLTLIATIGTKYGVNLTAAALREAKTAGGLWQLIQSRLPRHE